MTLEDFLPQGSGETTAKLQKEFERISVRRDALEAIALAAKKLVMKHPTMEMWAPAFYKAVRNLEELEAKE